MTARTAAVVAAAALTTAVLLLACPGPLQDGVFKPSPSPSPLPNKPGLVAVLVPNRLPGAAQRCPVLVNLVEVGEGKVQSRAGIPITSVSSYLPSNEVEPKAGCLQPPCPRMALFFEAGWPGGDGDGGGPYIDPCSGNPMMEGPGGSGGWTNLRLDDALLIRVAQDADRAREAALSLKR